MKKLLKYFGIIIVILLTIVVVKTLSIKSQQPDASLAPTSAPPEISGAVERLSKSITFKTVSFDDTSLIDYSQFVTFHQFLKASFPLTFANLKVDTISNYTLLLTWKGKDSTLAPAILMAHQDVVPVSDDTKDLWNVPAFEGLLKDGILYGRGVIDDKINLMAQLETVEYLVSQKFTPIRTIYFVFGHDEEIGGEMGAKKVAQKLKNEGIKAAFVMDEGGIITYEKVPGMEKPVALIGTSEKGYMTLELEVNIPGGHSSFPGKNTAIDVLAKAVADLKNSPFSPQIAPSVEDFITWVSPEMPFHQKMVMGNAWLFKPLIYRIYGSTSIGDAMIRTTIAPTIFSAGIKENVVPTIAKAKVNFRLLPGNTIQDVVEHTRKAINNDVVKITVLPNAKEATATSSVDSLGFQSMISPVKHHFEDAVVAPFLMIGGTDSRHFGDVSPNIYKFSPMIDPIGFHGVNEQLKVADYKRTLGFYLEFIKGL